MNTERAATAHSLRLIVRNAAMLLSSTVVIQVLSLLSGMMLTRHLKASGYGHYAFSYVFAWFLLTIINLGSRGVTLKDLPRQPEKAGVYLTQVILLRCVLAVPALVVAIAAGNWLDVPVDVKAAMALFMLMTVTDSLSLVFADVFRSLEDMRHESWLYVAERAGIVLCVALAVQQGWGIVPIITMMYVVSLCRTLAWLVPAHRRLQIPPIRIDWTFWRYLVRTGWQYLRVDLAVAVAQRADVLLLGVLATAADTGRYNSAYTVFQIALILPQMMTSALQPTSARLSHESPDVLIPTQLRVARGTLLLAMPIIIALGAAAPDVMGLLFGPSFHAAGTILRWLTMALPTLILTGFAMNHIFAIGRQDLTFWIVVANAGLNLGLNALLIPRLGTDGAVVATVASETLGLAAALAVTWGSVGRPLLLQSLPIWLMGMGAYAIAVAVALAGWNAWGGAVLATLTYLILLLATGLLPVGLPRRQAT